MLDLNNNLLLQNFHWIPQETKIFYHKKFSHENIQWWIFPKLWYVFHSLHFISFHFISVPLSEENLSTRKMCPREHIFLGNPVLLDRIHYPPQNQMSPCKIIHWAISLSLDAAMDLTNLIFTNLVSLVLCVPTCKLLNVSVQLFKIERPCAIT